MDYLWVLVNCHSYLGEIGNRGEKKKKAAHKFFLAIYISLYTLVYTEIYVKIYVFVCTHIYMRESERDENTM